MKYKKSRDYFRDVTGKSLDNIAKSTEVITQEIENTTWKKVGIKNCGFEYNSYSTNIDRYLKPFYFITKYFRKIKN